MLVYGERPRRERTRGLIADLRARLAALPAAGPPRRAALVEALILAAELAQGLADAEFAARGADAPSEAQDAAMAVVMAAARAVVAALRGGREAVDAGPVERLAALPLPESVETKAGEGYAFYALYPEAYAEAAQRSGLGPETTVIGIRSIGVGLAAMVGAALGAEAPVTMRPTGHPFRRTLALAPGLADRLRAAATGDFAVVDEGPGLSGSSFQAVADALAGLGADPTRIVFFPSHGGEPGAQADPAWRERWRAAERPVVGFDALALTHPDPAQRLEGWIADLTGPLTAPLEDLSGGAWRPLVCGGEAGWPPANTYQERRKFLARSESGAWLVKFAGLGRDAHAALARARTLSEAGFAPPVAGLRHGFLVERWIEDAQALDPDAFGRDRLVEHLGRYLAFRAANFPAGPEAGASLAALVEMGRVNAGEALGARAAAAFDRWGRAERLQIRRVETDNRLQPWEWRVAADGRLLKTDAIDHAHAHDLVGAQDIAWDLAGAIAEFDLSPDEAARLAVTAGGADPELLALMRPCYLAFQLGACAMAADAHGGWPEEQTRLSGARDRYARRLEALLCGAGGSTEAAGRA